jgi:predicted Ser/Thr protein kinase
MPEATARHPRADELRAYGQGLLPAEASRTLETHLAGCASCCEVLAQAPGDSFLLRLRAAGLTTPDAPRPAADTAVPPELVEHPRYRVLGLVGQGGMGAVYRAEHRRMERPVALKVIHPRLMQHPAAVRRFHQEVRAAARLHHPHIVTAYDADQAGGLHFLVMEYVEGESLAEVVRRRGPLPAGEACACARQAALALQHAHERGMVHRDVKPHNLMLQAGRVKILDFGLALLKEESGTRKEEAGKAMPSSGRATGTGAVMGTADYIAPEQAADARAADIRADVYSLGCTLFHLLAGRPPFPDGDVADKLARHAAGAVPRLAPLRPDLPAGLSALVARLTARDPADRPATPAEVAAALAPFCPADEVRPTRRRWPLVAAALLLAAALLAGGIALRPRPVEVGQTLVRPPEVIAPPISRPKAPVEPAVPVVSAEEAETLVVKRGGRVRRDRSLPGRPVVQVVLSGRPATDDDLAVLSAFPDLEVLDLSRTQVTDAGMRRLAGLKRLRELVLFKTAVGDAGMQAVGQLTALETLELQFTGVGDAGLGRLTGLARLRDLSLVRTRVTSAGMAHVARLKSLAALRLDMTAVTDEGLGRLTGLSGLTCLTLFGARRVGDEGMKSVARFPRLQTLDLCTTRVTDRGVKDLAGLVRLKSLRLSARGVTDEGVRLLAPLTGLQLLDVGNTQVTDAGLRELARLPELTDLNLQGLSGVTDAGLDDLARLSRLRSLILCRTAVTDAGVRKLTGFPALTYVNLKDLPRATGAGAADLRAARPRMTVLH